MLTFLIVSAIKLVIHSFVLILVPVHLLVISLPPIDTTVAVDAISRITLVFVWLFGHPAYYFFISTVLMVFVFFPVYMFTFYLFRLFIFIKGIVR